MELRHMRIILDENKPKNLYRGYLKGKTTPKRKKRKRERDVVWVKS